MGERVSILLATRNRADLLTRAIASLQRQTHRNLEICVLDDGSSDDTPEALEQLARADARIRWWRREQSLGLANALNMLIDRATGTWLARMDDDDWAHPERIAIQLEFMRAQRLDVCGTWYRRIAGWRRSCACPAVEHEAICTELLFQPPLLHPSVMMRRHLIERCGGYPEDYPHAEDYALWLALLPHARFGNCPRLLMDYRLSVHQVSRAYHPAQLLSAQRLRAKALDLMEITHNARQRMLHSHLRDPVPIENIERLQEVYEWLAVLAEQVPSAGQGAITRQAYLQTVRAAGIGLAAWAAFAQTRWAAAIGAKSKAELWGLCLLRLRYQSALYKRLEPLARIG